MGIWWRYAACICRRLYFLAHLEVWRQVERQGVNSTRRTRCPVHSGMQRDSFSDPFHGLVGFLVPGIREKELFEDGGL